MTTPPTLSDILDRLTEIVIADCYPCDGRGFVHHMGWRTLCSNCGGSGVSPTWEMSDGSASKARADGGVR